MAEFTRREPDTMRRLILIRHAKSDYPWGVEDHFRPLNGRGRRDAPLIGEWLLHNIPVLEPPVVVVSTATRTQLTWRLIREQLSGVWAECEVVEEPSLYETDADGVAAVISGLPDSADTAVLIGHNPGLVDFISRYTEPGTAKDDATAKFPTSALAVVVTSSLWGSCMSVPMVIEHFAVARAPRKS
jgi:phosphohistidine phosphatase